MNVRCSGSVGAFLWSLLAPGERQMECGSCELEGGCPQAAYLTILETMEAAFKRARG